MRTRLFGVWTHHHFFFWLLLNVSAFSRRFIPVTSFQLRPPPTQPFFQRSSLTAQLIQSSSSDEETEEDWRDFRAKLVMQEQGQGDGSTASSSDSSSVSAGGGSWAYESGKTIEKGSVIISRPEQDFGFGLHQQYFHKCVMLVLHHDEQFTKGVILNRPTDLLLSDDDFINEDGTPVENATSDDSGHWKVWYGGDVQGIQSEHPEIICLHSITSLEANNVSEKILKNIQWTTLAGAHKLVRDGHCHPEDFYIVCGYAGWAPGQLMGELERESWFMAATDSQTLLMELRKEDQDPRDAGLETWTKLMERIGKGNVTNNNNNTTSSENFDDLMLREWARENLLLAGSKDKKKSNNEEKLEDMLELAESILRDGDIRIGKILRAASSSPSHSPPFLLDNQEFHQSLVLIIQDDEVATVGLVLNLISDKAIELEVLDATPVPLRFGGSFGVQGKSEKPVVWLHCNDALRNARVGSPLRGKYVDDDDDDDDDDDSNDLDDDDKSIWICSKEDAELAVRKGLASSTDFMAISGFTVWPKGRGTVGGILGEILEGRFERIEADKVQEAWDILINEQEILNADNMDEMLSVAESAWNVLRRDEESPLSIESLEDNANDTDMVYQSNITVRELADAALRTWVATFLLRNPKIRSV